MLQLLSVAVHLENFLSYNEWKIRRNYHDPIEGISVTQCI